SGGIVGVHFAEGEDREVVLVKKSIAESFQTTLSFSNGITTVDETGITGRRLAKYAAITDNEGRYAIEGWYDGEDVEAVPPDANVVRQNLEMRGRSRALCDREGVIRESLDRMKTYLNADEDEGNRRFYERVDVDVDVEGKSESRDASGSRGSGTGRGQDNEFDIQIFASSDLVLVGTMPRKPTRMQLAFKDLTPNDRQSFLTNKVKVNNNKKQGHQQRGRAGRNEDETGLRSFQKRGDGGGSESVVMVPVSYIDEGETDDVMMIPPGSAHTKHLFRKDGENDMEGDGSGVLHLHFETLMASSHASYRSQRTGSLLSGSRRVSRRDGGDSLRSLLISMATSGAGTNDASHHRLVRRLLDLARGDRGVVSELIRVSRMRHGEGVGVERRSVDEGDLMFSSAVFAALAGSGHEEVGTQNILFSFVSFEKTTFPNLCSVFDE
ncbi:hypothetical protein HK102_009581, partial [Quaeritorhiza haematococci]